jgi:ABC-type multidrug transport system ATPase subunit
VISLVHVTRTYRSWRGKEIHALVDFSLDIRAGEVFGLAGPNGAGKSTLISLLLGFLGPTAGEIRVGGMDPRRYVETFGVGYLSELINIPPTWRVVHALERYALLSE